MVNLPSALVTAKNGCVDTFTYIFIHGWLLHWMGTINSGLANFFSIACPPGYCDSFQPSFSCAMEWMLCSAGSLFRTCSVCPTIMPRTCGTYLQPRWSRVAGEGVE